MSVDMMDRKVKELRELKRMQEELTAEIEAIQDELKAHMDTHGTDTLLGFDWKVTWKPVTSNRLDSTALKEGAAGHRRPLHEAKHRPPVRAGLMSRALIQPPDQERCIRAHRPPGGGQVQCTTAPSRLQGGNNR